MEKEIVCITSHANSDEKVSLLRRCLGLIKSYGYDVILSSHINVPQDIIDESDYFILSKKNPIIRYDEYDTIGGSISYWQDYSDYYLNKKVDFNHGLAHLRLILQASSIANQEGYSIIHLINYDYIVNDVSVLKDITSNLNSNDAYFFSWKNLNSIITGMMSFRINKLLRLYGHIIEKQDYCFYNLSIFEDLFLHIIKESGLKYHIEDRSNLNGKVQQDFINVLDAYGCYKCEDTEIRIILCKENSGQHFIFIKSEKNINQNYVNIYYDGRYYSIFISVNPQFIEITDEMLNKGFTISVSKGSINLKFDSKSNISDCVIKNKNIVIKII